MLVRPCRSLGGANTRLIRGTWLWFFGCWVLCWDAVSGLRKSICRGQLGGGGQRTVLAALCSAMNLILSLSR